MSASLTAIDCDGHILERTADVRKYFEGPWKNRETPLWPGCQPWDSSFGDTIGHPYGYLDSLSREEQVDLWHKILDENNIEKVVLYPTGSHSIPKLQEKEYAVAACKAVNSHFAKDYANKRLFPVGVLPLKSPKAAAEDLKRAAGDLGLRAFELAPTGLPVALGDDIYDPIYQEAERLGVAIVVHGTRHWGHEVGADKLRTFSEVHCYAFVAAMMLQFTSMVASGITVKFPNLHLGFLEVGGTWLPYYLDRMDEHWEKRGKVDMPLLKEAPSEVFKKSNIKVSIEASERTLPSTIDYCGVQHFMFASDVPHWDCEFPHNLKHIRMDKKLTDAQKQKILYDNAKEFYRF